MKSSSAKGSDCQSCVAQDTAQPPKPGPRLPLAAHLATTSGHGLHITQGSPPPRAEATPEAVTADVGQGPPVPEATWRVSPVGRQLATVLHPEPRGTEARGTYSCTEPQQEPLQPVAGATKAEPATMAWHGWPLLPGNTCRVWTAPTPPGGVAAAAAGAQVPEGPRHSQSSHPLGCPATQNKTLRKNLLGTTN